MTIRKKLFHARLKGDISANNIKLSQHLYILLRAIFLDQNCKILWNIILNELFRLNDTFQINCLYNIKWEMV
jgi:hypothetical protein